MKRWEGKLCEIGRFKLQSYNEVVMDEGEWRVNTGRRRCDGRRQRGESETRYDDGMISLIVSLLPCKLCVYNSLMGNWMLRAIVHYTATERTTP